MCCSGQLGKLRKYWAFDRDDTYEGRMVGKHERNWADIDSVYEAVEGVS